MNDGTITIILSKLNDSLNLVKFFNSISSREDYLCEVIAKTHVVIETGDTRSGIHNYSVSITKKNYIKVSGYEGTHRFGRKIVAKFHLNGKLKSVKIENSFKKSSKFTSKKDAKEFYLGLELTDLLVKVTDSKLFELITKS